MCKDRQSSITLCALIMTRATSLICRFGSPLLLNSGGLFCPSGLGGPSPLTILGGMSSPLGFGGLLSSSRREGLSSLLGLDEPIPFSVGPWSFSALLAMI